MTPSDLCVSLRLKASFNFFFIIFHEDLIGLSKSINDLGKPLKKARSELLFCDQRGKTLS